MLDIIRIFMSFMGAFGFALVFHLRGKRLFFASLGGLLCGLTFYIISRISNSEVVCYFVASVAVMIYAEVAARILKSPVTSFLGAGVIPLVPGGNMYFAMSAALHGDLNMFLEQGTDAIYIALSIAAGIAVISPIRKIIAEIMNITSQ